MVFRQHIGMTIFQIITPYDPICPIGICYIRRIFICEYVIITPMSNKPNPFKYQLLLAYIILLGLPWYILIMGGIQTREIETLVLLMACALLFTLPLFLLF